MTVIAVENVKNVPTAPTYISNTIHDGKLYRSLLSPSIWNGRHKAAATAALNVATAEIAKATAKGIFHKNTAARKVSRLTKAVNAIA